MNTISIPAVKTTFCSIVGESKNPTDVWFVLHGYGQLASYFIRHFEVLDNGSTVIAAPEAPSRFYLSNEYGRVGASWMTKHEREADISDLNTYLNQMFDAVSARFTITPSTRFHFLGFSQGAAVLCRWLAQREVSIHQLILWAGSVPQDMPVEDLRHLMSRGKSIFIYGTEDPYLKQTQFPILQTMMNEQNLPVEVKTFTGEHTLDAELIKELAHIN